MPIRALLLAALLLTTSLATQAAPVPLQVGGKTVVFPAPAGHVAISRDHPKLFEYSAAALPPGNRLVESFYTPADLDRVLAGNVIADIYYQVQAPRALESQDLAIGDWTRIKAELIASMPRLDIAEVLAEDAERGERMSKVAGERVELKFAGIQTPTISRETPTSLTYGMTVPISLDIGGDAQQVTLAVAAAAVFVRNRLLYVFAYTSDTSPAGVAALHRGFAATVDEMGALNASAPGVASRGGTDWHRVAGKALIGALVGAVIGLFGWWLRKRRRR